MKCADMRTTNAGCAALFRIKIKEKIVDWKIASEEK
jgi:hypothetical protein